MHTAWFLGTWSDTTDRPRFSDASGGREDDDTSCNRVTEDISCWIMLKWLPGREQNLLNGDREQSVTNIVILTTEEPYNPFVNEVWFLIHPWLQRRLFFVWGKEHEPYLEFIVYMSAPLHIKGMELYDLSHIECPPFIVAVCWYLWISVNSLRILYPLKDVRDTIVFKSLSNHHLVTRHLLER